MKKLSSDIAFYIMLAQILIIPIFIIGFSLFGPIALPIEVYFIGALLIIISIFSLVRLFKKYKVFYAEDKFIAYSYLSPNTAIEIPFSSVIDITQKVAIRSMTNISNLFSIVYNDDGKAKKISFLSSTMISIFQLKNLISDSRQYVKPIAPINVVDREIGVVSFHQQLDAGKRLAAATTDHFIMTLVAMIFGAPLIFFEMQSKADTPKDFYWYLFLVGFALYFCKDCINGQSLAKRLLKQQVVNNKTGQIANSLRCFVRDIFIIIWPVEVIMILINPARRLGDIIAGTKVIVFDPELEIPPINYSQITASFVLAYAVAVLSMTVFSY